MYNCHSLYYCKVNGLRRILIWTDVFGFIGYLTQMSIDSTDITVLGELKRHPKREFYLGPL